MVQYYYYMLVLHAWWHCRNRSSEQHQKVNLPTNEAMMDASGYGGNKQPFCVP